MKSNVFQKFLIDYWDKFNDKPPWTVDKTPYKVLVVEIMFSRTKFDQVRKIYGDFFDKFTCIGDLAKSEVQDIEVEIRSLGLIKRAKVLKDMASKIKTDENIPREFDELISIRGIGEYAASAIMCFAYGVKMPIIDSNVNRIFNRYFYGNKKKLNANLKELITKTLPDEGYVRYNYGLIFFGIHVCTPKNQKCDACEISEKCKYNSNNRKIILNTVKNINN